jgi:hypothetical protein
MAVLGKLGKGIYSAGKGAMKSKGAAATLIGGSFLAGFAGKGSEEAISNMMDISFGTPDADNMMLGGQDLTPSMAMGALAPGFLGTAARAKNFTEFGQYGPETVTFGVPAAAGIGGVAGGMLGKAMKAKGSRIGGVRGAIGGAVIGGAIGLAGAAQIATAPYRKNKQIFKNSPYYNTSLSNAERLNASGDIVLGMHNSRRG